MVLSCPPFSSHQITGNLSGQPVYLRHAGNPASYMVVAVPRQPFLIKRESRSGAEPKLSRSRLIFASGPTGLGPSPELTTINAAMGPVHGHWLTRRPPETDTKPRNSSASPQPEVIASHPPLLPPPMNSLPISTQKFDSTHFRTART